MKSQSQYGQEDYILELFENKKDGFFVEVGAYDGVTFSNTLLLEKLGWRGLLIEGNLGKLEECRKNRSVICEHAVVWSCEEEVQYYKYGDLGSGIDRLFSTTFQSKPED